MEQVNGQLLKEQFHENYAERLLTKMKDKEIFYSC